MPSLADAIALAAKAHGTQRDKSGEPCLLHALRVMLRMKGKTERIVAVLHDVIEDTDVTLDGLRRAGFSREAVRAVDALSRRNSAGETYDAFTERIAKNPLAVRVKLGDLADNMSPERAKGRTATMSAKYRRAWKRLTGRAAPGERARRTC